MNKGKKRKREKTGVGTKNPSDLILWAPSSMQIDQLQGLFVAKLQDGYFTWETKAESLPKENQCQTLPSDALRNIWTAIQEQVESWVVEEGQVSVQAISPVIEDRKEATWSQSTN